MTGQMLFVIVQHEAGCPVGDGAPPSLCACAPTPRMVTEQEFTGAVNRDRKARRAAQREAEKAMRRAAQRGGT
jgi:hypothetical protein